PIIAGEDATGPIPRFAERDLVIGDSARADFAMLPAGEINGEIVTADGKPAAAQFVSAAAVGQRRGYSVAYDSSDARGSFRLKGIPANKPIIFTVNPAGRPGETSQSAPKKFEPAAAYKIRIVLPPGGSGNGAIRVH
ncbi:MAG: hypothetical protein JJ992_10925, partial [Planctomycetes bacterium]|nr:hypothetical protein [Planctomycetota bacterium]